MGHVPVGPIIPALSQHSPCRLQHVPPAAQVKESDKNWALSATAIQVGETDEGDVIAQKDSASSALLPQSLCPDFLMWLVPGDGSVYYYLFYFSRQGLLKVPLAPSRNFAYCIHCLSLCPFFYNLSPLFTTADSSSSTLSSRLRIFLIDRVNPWASLLWDQV